MADVTNSKLLHIDTGILKKDACIVLVKTEWNAAISDQLELGCIAVLEQYNIKKTIVLTVPGAVEISFCIKRFWDNASKKNRPDAFIALGRIIKGDTRHFHYVFRAEP